MASHGSRKMTRKEAIKEIIRAYDVLDFSCHMDNHRKEAFNMAKLALEQEPILDKIRAELTEKRDILVKEARANAINPLSCYGLDYALLIIDKYKAESENP